MVGLIGTLAIRSLLLLLLTSGRTTWSATRSVTSATATRTVSGGAATAATSVDALGKRGSHNVSPPMTPQQMRPVNAVSTKR